MNTFKKITFLIVAVFLTVQLSAQDALFTYYSVKSRADVSTIKTNLKEKLKAEGFAYLGEYHPAGNPNTSVIVCTHKDIYGVALSGKSHKVLGCVLKFGINKKGSVTTISLLNPEYVFYAYFRNTTKQYPKLKGVSDKAIAVLKSQGKAFSAFGGKLTKSQLKSYHYMIGMPYFNEPVVLKEFSSHKEACETIEKNLAAKKGNTQKVFKLKFNKSEMAIYGVALKDKAKGEAFFLPTIGPDHIAAMPYEIVVVGKKAMMLHGKYRFALLWPKLTMGQFMKIVNTPSDVETTLKGLTK